NSSDGTFQRRAHDRTARERSRLAAAPCSQVPLGRHPWEADRDELRSGRGLWRAGAAGVARASNNDAAPWRGRRRCGAARRPADARWPTAIATDATGRSYVLKVNGAVDFNSTYADDVFGNVAAALLERAAERGNSMDQRRLEVSPML